MPRRGSTSISTAERTGATGDWRRADGQQRSQPLSVTLIAARAAAQRAGVTRLSDVSGLSPFRTPVFQAVRPLARSLSVSQGKGLTPMAAMVSALLESVELDVAERVARPPGAAPLADLGEDAIALWQGAARDALALRLDPALSRSWLTGRCLASGRALPLPFDLVSLDFTARPQDDAQASSSGLASGNSMAEAASGAVAELLERDLSAVFAGVPPRARRAAEIDLDTIDDPLVRLLLRRIARAGHDVRLWSMGQDYRIAAMRCAIVDRADHPALPPTVGSGCHPHRSLATLRAVLEAVQVHATLVAGARDDLRQHHYDDPAQRRLELILGTLSFDKGALDWSAVPDTATAQQEATLETLLGVAALRSPLPVIGFEHAGEADGIAVFRAVAPGLTDATREGDLPKVTLHRPRAAPRPRPPVVFIGPTLGDACVPPGIEQAPPAVCGDLAALLAHPPAAVGLVDGCFVTQPSVWHKEILDLLAHGIPVFGAASIGALRAAELHTLGMVGVGEIFAAYRDGRIVRDDAVMLLQAPGELGWRALTLTLVEAEAALHATAMEPADRRMLLRIVRTTPYAARTWPHCLTLFSTRTGRSPPVDAATLAAQPSIKHADAQRLFDLLADGAYRAPVSPPVSLTAGYAGLLAELTARRQ